MKAISINAYEIKNNDGETMVFMTPKEFDFIKKQNELKDKEIERLNNIINELERYINEEYIYDELGMKIFDASKLQDKLQELKGVDKE